ncbi:hypothetical protein SAMN05444483_11149 [Salegentibacter echinorum]|uniref:Cytochrome C n=1 Tax=Salegentibacter echinorum TaxID=1073325 RepID=A0A1M5JK31_SALEC|nr:cytochrome C [Salegentibacter echinorum]SHG40878.1 hypothetical protein SAMN05444483_11149 [Salegentibacter echinorum]
MKTKMEEDKRIVKVFLDDETQPFAEFAPPVKFVLDSTKIPDGKHKLKIVAKSSSGVEGIRIVPFEVRNGPEISLVGLKDNEVIDTQNTITINAYGSETNDSFVIRGSETPKAIPAWVWMLVIAFIAFGLFYIVMYWTPEFYKSFF